MIGLTVQLAALTAREGRLPEDVLDYIVRPSNNNPQPALVAVHYGRSAAQKGF